LFSVFIIGFPADMVFAHRLVPFFYDGDKKSRTEIFLILKLLALIFTFSLIPVFSVNLF